MTPIREPAEILYLIDAKGADAIPEARRADVQKYRDDVAAWEALRDQHDDSGSWADAEARAALLGAQKPAQPAWLPELGIDA